MRCQPLMILLTLLGLLASLAVAGDRDGSDLRPILARSQQSFEFIGATPDAGKAARDTVCLLGGPDRLDGRFEDHNGVPDWQGWTSRDFTYVPETRWQISDFNAAGLNGHPAGNLAMWCGTYFGENPGYGNDWNASLVWTAERMRALEEALLDFPGCAVVVSHDRWFLDRVSTHILAFEGNSNVHFFEGGYSDYEENKKKRMGDASPHRIKYRTLQKKG